MSKELEALESLIEKFSKVVMNETNIPQTKDNVDKCVDYTKKCFKDEINIVKSALERKDKLEKAWEIIRPIVKETTYFHLKKKQNFGEDELAYYLVIDGNDYRLKTETEFNLIKGIVGEK